MLKKKKIIQVIDTLEQGGAQQLLYDILKNLKDDFEFLVLSFEGGPVADKINSLNVPVKVLGLVPGKIGFKHPKNIKKVNNWLRNNYYDFKPDIIQTHLLGADIWARLIAPKKVKLVQTVHSAEDFRGRLLNKKGFKTWFFDRLFFGKTNRVVAVSPAAKNALARQGIKNKVIIIPTGVDLTKFKTDGTARREIRKKLGWDNKIIVGSVGRLDPVKGYDSLIKDFQNVSQKNKQLQLVLIGKGSQESELKQLIKNLELGGKVQLLGERQDISQLLNGLDMFVCSSIWEGMPIAVLEAMAVGLPILSTKNGGVEELIKDQETGLLYSMGVDLEEKIIKLINNSSLAQKLGENARNRVVKFDIKNIAKKYYKIYHNL